MTDDTAALVTWLRALEAQAQRLAECDGDLADLASVNAFKACADLIERQGKVLRAVEALAANLRRLDKFAYAADIYDALERDD